MMTYSVGLIGCGKIGYLNDKNLNKGTYSYFQSIRKHKKFKLVAVVDIKKSIRTEISKKYKIPAYFSYDKMMREHNLDLVIVATNDPSHYEILMSIVNYNPKFVFTEKPLANTSAEIKKIISKYKKKQVPLSVNFSRRFSPTFNYINDLLKNNHLGNIESVNMQYSRGFIHNAIHLLDLSLWYFGIPKSIEIDSIKPSKSFKGDKTIDLRMNYNSNMNVKLNGLDIDYLGNEEIDIIGSSGRIRVQPDDEYQEYKIIPHKNYFKTRVFKKVKVKKINNMSLIKNALDMIYQYLNGSSKKIISPADNSGVIDLMLKNIK